MSFSDKQRVLTVYSYCLLVLEHPLLLMACSYPLSIFNDNCHFFLCICKVVSIKIVIFNNFRHFILFLWCLWLNQGLEHDRQATEVNIQSSFRYLKYTFPSCYLLMLFVLSFLDAGDSTCGLGHARDLYCVCIHYHFLNFVSTFLSGSWFSNWVLKKAFWLKSGCCVPLSVCLASSTHPSSSSLPLSLYCPFRGWRSYL